MSKKEIRKRCQELIYLGMKGIFTSEGYKEYKELTDKLPNKALLHIAVYILGILFAPRLLLLYLSNDKSYFDEFLFAISKKRCIFAQ